MVVLQLAVDGVFRWEKMRRFGLIHNGWFCARLFDSARNDLRTKEITLRNNEMRRRRFLATLGAAGASTVLLPTMQSTASGQPNGLMVLIGSYTSSEPPGHGLDVAHRAAGGALKPAGKVDGVPDASFLAWSPDHRFVYATNERDNGTVTALDVTGQRPKVINKRSSRGAGPTHVTVHPNGKYVLTANYTDGTVAVHRRNADGSLGESTDLVAHKGTNRQAHAHQVLADPSGNWVTAVDLGTDSVYVYALNPNTGKLTEKQQLTLPTGSGPRHLTFHPGGNHAYLLSELKSEITVLSWDYKAGKFTAGQVIGTRADGATGENFPAEIAVSQDGGFVYASNRGDDNIATLAVNGDPNKLTWLGVTPTGGQWPRHFTLDPEEKTVYIANQNSGTITCLARDTNTGKLTPAPGQFKYPAVAMLTFHH